MTRTFLRQIRVVSMNEIRERILPGIAEINKTPVVLRWKAFEALAATDGAERMVSASMIAYPP